MITRRQNLQQEKKNERTRPYDETYIDGFI